MFRSKLRKTLLTLSEGFGNGGWLREFTGNLQALWLQGDFDRIWRQSRWPGVPPGLSTLFKSPQVAELILHIGLCLPEVLLSRSVLEENEACFL